MVAVLHRFIERCWPLLSSKATGRFRGLVGVPGFVRRATGMKHTCLVKLNDAVKFRIYILMLVILDMGRNARQAQKCDALNSKVWTVLES